MKRGGLGFAMTTVLSASLPDDIRNDPVESRVHLLRRFYGRDLDAEMLEAVIAQIRLRVSRHS